MGTLDYKICHSYVGVVLSSPVYPSLISNMTGFSNLITRNTGIPVFQINIPGAAAWPNDLFFSEFHTNFDKSML